MTRSGPPRARQRHTAPRINHDELSSIKVWVTRQAPKNPSGLSQGLEHLPVSMARPSPCTITCLYTAEQTCPLEAFTDFSLLQCGGARDPYLPLYHL